MAACAAVAMLAGSYVPAHAEMLLSQVIVDLQPVEPGHDDIEVWNAGSERIFVVAEPSEILSPGQPDERRVSNPDPAVSGLLVSPQRIVLEPGQRQIVRVAAVTPRRDTDRIYRVTIKPVAGEIHSQVTALKVLLGYDVLVLYRPDKPVGEVTATRSGRKIMFHNEGNTARELFAGKQCNDKGKNCKDMPATRLYAGTSWELDLEYDTPVAFQVSDGNHTALRHF